MQFQAAVAVFLQLLAIIITPTLEASPKLLTTSYTIIRVQLTHSQTKEYVQSGPHLKENAKDSQL